MPVKAARTPKTRSQQGKRHPLNMRTTEAVRRKLEAAATISGRSLAQEVEARIEQSFQSESVRRGLLGDVADLAYGSNVAGLVMLLGMAMRTAAWRTHPDPGFVTSTGSLSPSQLRQVVLAARLVLDHFDEGLEQPNDGKSPMGEVVAGGILDWLDAEAKPTEDRESFEARERLKPLLANAKVKAQ